MKTWIKVLVCMVLSFASLFMTVGYAALTDTLTITGTANIDRVVYYTVTYLVNNEVYAVDEVTDNSVAYTVRTDGPANGNAPFKYWVNANAAQMTSIPAGNTVDYTLSAIWKNIYLILFADVDGNVLYQETFVEGTTALSPEGQAIVDTKLGELNAIAATQDMSVAWSDYDMQNAKGDITVRPLYSYNGSLDLVPVYEEPDDGIVDYYQVGGYKDDEGIDMVKIPDEFGGKEITTINANAFASYPDLHCVTIPITVTYLGEYAFAEDWGLFDSGETQALYYEGSYQDWQNNMQYAQKAFNGLSDNTRIFFLNGGDTVDPSQGYLQVAKENTGSFIRPNYVGQLKYYEGSNIDQSFINNYTQTCDCGKVDHAETGGLRPDYIYWVDVAPIALEHVSDEIETNESELIWDGIDNTNMDDWYPLDEQYPTPGDNYEIVFEPTQGYIMAETISVTIDDTEYVVHTNGYEPEGELVPTYDPNWNVLTIPAELLTDETKVVAIAASAVPVEAEEKTDATEETDPTEASTAVTNPTEVTTEPTTEAATVPATTPATEEPTIPTVDMTAPPTTVSTGTPEETVEPITETEGVIVTTSAE